jgi:hypothetical protein
MNGLPLHLRAQAGPTRSGPSRLAARAAPGLPAADVLPWRPLRPQAAAVHTGAAPTHCSDAVFWRLLVDYRPHGGLAREREVLGRFPATHRALAACQAAPLRFEWAGGVWLPWVQFVDRTDILHPGIAAVVAELSPVFTGWDCTRWFVEPNAWLNHQRPLDILHTDREAAIEAARADRFVAVG